MVTNNIIPLHFKTRALKHIFLPLKECVLMTEGLAGKKSLCCHGKQGNVMWLYGYAAVCICNQFIHLCIVSAENLVHLSVE